jgi:hypothetical protein
MCTSRGGNPLGNPSSVPGAGPDKREPAGDIRLPVGPPGNPRKPWSQPQTDVPGVVRERCSLIESEEEKMSTQTQMNRATAQMPTARQMPDGGRMAEGRMPAPGSETKPAVLSTEFWVYLAAVGGVLLASWWVGSSGNGPGVDIFQANQAWWLITLLTIAYLGSRGLAKLGSSWRHRQRR